MWKHYALLSALFAALMAISAKIGVKDINSNLATAIRTTVILLLTWGIVLFSGRLNEIKGISYHIWSFLLLSGLATGLSWLFYFKALQTGDVSHIAPIDNLSVVITILLAFFLLNLNRSLEIFSCKKLYYSRLYHRYYICTLTQYASFVLFQDKMKANFSNDRFGLKEPVNTKVIIGAL